MLDIIGIATEAGVMHTVDLLHYNCRDGWDEGERELAEMLQQQYRFLTKVVASYVQIDEYPNEFSH